MPDYERIAEGVNTPEEFLGPISRELREEVEGAWGGVPSPDPATRGFLPENHEKYQGLAAARGYEQADWRLENVRYTHDAMIDLILAEPTIKQHELAKKFGYSEGWISRVLGSDAFQAALAKRRDDLMNPVIAASMEERFRGLAIQSIEVISEKLEKSKNVDVALKTLDVSAKALGFGARQAPGGGNHLNFVVQLPPKAENSSDWAERHTGGKVIEQ